MLEPKNTMLRQDTLNESIYLLSELISEGKRRKAIKALRALSAHRDQKLVNRETKLADRIHRTPHDLLNVAKDGKRLLKSRRKAKTVDRALGSLTKEDLEAISVIIENLDDWEFDVLLSELSDDTLRSYRRKALRNARDAAYSARFSHASQRKIVNRLRGIVRTSARLAK